MTAERIGVTAQPLGYGTLTQPNIFAQRANWQYEPVSRFEACGITTWEGQQQGFCSSSQHSVQNQQMQTSLPSNYQYENAYFRVPFHEQNNLSPYPLGRGMSFIRSQTIVRHHFRSSISNHPSAWKNKYGTQNSPYRGSLNVNNDPVMPPYFMSHDLQNPVSQNPGCTKTEYINESARQDLADQRCPSSERVMNECQYLPFCSEEFQKMISSSTADRNQKNSSTDSVQKNIPQNFSVSSHGDDIPNKVKENIDELTSQYLIDQGCQSSQTVVRHHFRSSISNHPSAWKSKYGTQNSPYKGSLNVNNDPVMIPYILSHDQQNPVNQNPGCTKTENINELARQDLADQRCPSSERVMNECKYLPFCSEEFQKMIGSPSADQNQKNSSMNSLKQQSGKNLNISFHEDEISHEDNGIQNANPKIAVSKDIQTKSVFITDDLTSSSSQKQVTPILSDVSGDHLVRPSQVQCSTLLQHALSYIAKDEAQRQNDDCLKRNSENAGMNRLETLQNVECTRPSVAMHNSRREQMDEKEAADDSNLRQESTEVSHLTQDDANFCSIMHQQCRPLLPNQISVEDLQQNCSNFSDLLHQVAEKVKTDKENVSSSERQVSCCRDLKLGREEVAKVRKSIQKKLGIHKEQNVSRHQSKQSLSDVDSKLENRVASFVDLTSNKNTSKKHGKKNKSGKANRNVLKKIEQSECESTPASSVSILKGKKTRKNIEERWKEIVENASKINAPKESKLRSLEERWQDVSNVRHRKKNSILQEQGKRFEPLRCSEQMDNLCAKIPVSSKLKKISLVKTENKTGILENMEAKGAVSCNTLVDVERNIKRCSKSDDFLLIAKNCTQTTASLPLFNSHIYKAKTPDKTTQVNESKCGIKSLHETRSVDTSSGEYKRNHLSKLPAVTNNKDDKSAVKDIQSVVGIRNPEKDLKMTTSAGDSVNVVRVYNIPCLGKMYSVTVDPNGETRCRTLEYPPNKVNTEENMTHSNSKGNDKNGDQGHKFSSAGGNVMGTVACDTSGMSGLEILSHVASQRGKITEKPIYKVKPVNKPDRNLFTAIEAHTLKGSVSESCLDNDHISFVVKDKSQPKMTKEKKITEFTIQRNNDSLKNSVQKIKTIVDIDDKFGKYKTKGRSVKNKRKALSDHSYAKQEVVSTDQQSDEFNGSKLNVSCGKIGKNNSERLISEKILGYSKRKQDSVNHDVSLKKSEYSKSELRKPYSIIDMNPQSDLPNIHNGSLQHTNASRNIRFPVFSSILKSDESLDFSRFSGQKTMPSVSYKKMANDNENVKNTRAKSKMESLKFSAIIHENTGKVEKNSENNLRVPLSEMSPNLPLRTVSSDITAEKSLLVNLSDKNTLYQSDNLSKIGVLEKSNHNIPLVSKHLSNIIPSTSGKTAETPVFMFNNTDKYFKPTSKLNVKPLSKSHVKFTSVADVKPRTKVNVEPTPEVTVTATSELYSKPLSKLTLKPMSELNIKPISKVNVNSTAEVVKSEKSLHIPSFSLPQQHPLDMMPGKNTSLSMFRDCRRDVVAYEDLSPFSEIPEHFVGTAAKTVTSNQDLCLSVMSKPSIVTKLEPSNSNPSLNLCLEQCLMTQHKPVTNNKHSINSDLEPKTHLTTSVPKNSVIGSVGQTHLAHCVPKNSLIGSISQTCLTQSVPKTSMIGSLTWTHQTQNVPKTSTVESLAQTHLIRSVPKTSLIGSIAQTHLTQSLPKTHMIESVSQTHQTQSVPKTSMIGSVTHTHQTQSVPKTSIIGSTSLTHLTQSVPKTSMIRSVSQIHRTQNVSKTSMIGSLAQTHLIRSLPKTSLIGSIAQTRQTQSVPKTSTIGSTSQTHLTESVPKTTTMGSISPTHLTRILPKTSRIESTSQTHLTQNEPKAFTFGSASRTHLTESVPKTSMIESIAQTQLTQSVPKTSTVGSTSRTHLTESVPKTTTMGSISPTHLTRILPKTSRIESTSRTHLTQNEPKAFTFGSASWTYLTESVPKTSMIESIAQTQLTQSVPKTSTIGSTSQTHLTESVPKTTTMGSISPTHLTRILPKTSRIESTSQTHLTQNEPKAFTFGSASRTYLTESVPKTSMIESIAQTQLTQSVPKTSTIGSTSQTHLTESVPKTSMIESIAQTHQTQSVPKTSMIQSTAETHQTQSVPKTSTIGSTSQTHLTESVPKTATIGRIIQTHLTRIVPKTSRIESTSQTHLTQNEPKTFTFGSASQTHLTESVPKTSMIDSIARMYLKGSVPKTFTSESTSQTHLIQNVPKTSTIESLAQTHLTQSVPKTSMIGTSCQTHFAQSVSETSTIGTICQTSLTGTICQTSLTGTICQTSLTGTICQTSLTGNVLVSDIPSVSTLSKTARRNRRRKENKRRRQLLNEFNLSDASVIGEEMNMFSVSKNDAAKTVDSVINDVKYNVERCETIKSMESFKGMPCSRGKRNNCTIDEAIQRVVSRYKHLYAGTPKIPNASENETELVENVSNTMLVPSKDCSANYYNVERCQTIKNMEDFKGMPYSRGKRNHCTIDEAIQKVVSKYKHLYASTPKIPNASENETELVENVSNVMLVPSKDCSAVGKEDIILDNHLVENIKYQMPKENDVERFKVAKKDVFVVGQSSDDNDLYQGGDCKLYDIPRSNAQIGISESMQSVDPDHSYHDLSNTGVSNTSPFKSNAIVAFSTLKCNTNKSEVISGVSEASITVSSLKGNTNTSEVVSGISETSIMHSTLKGNTNTSEVVSGISETSIMHSTLKGNTNTSEVVSGISETSIMHSTLKGNTNTSEVVSGISETSIAISTLKGNTNTSEVVSGISETNIALSTLKGNSDNIEVDTGASEASIIVSTLKGNKNNNEVVTDVSEDRIAVSELKGNPNNCAVFRGASEASIIVSTLKGNKNNNEVVTDVSEDRIAVSELQGNTNNCAVFRGVSEASITVSELKGNTNNCEVVRDVSETSIAVSEVKGNTNNSEVIRGVSKASSAVSEVKGNTNNIEVVGAVSKASSAVSEVKGNTNNNEVIRGVSKASSAVSEVKGNTNNIEVVGAVSKASSAVSEVKGNTNNNEVVTGVSKASIAVSEVKGNTNNSEVVRGVSKASSTVSEVKGNTNNSEVVRGVSKASSAVSEVKGNTNNSEVIRGVSEASIALSTFKASIKNNEVVTGVSKASSTVSEVKGNTNNIEVVRAVSKASIAVSEVKGNTNNSEVIRGVSEASIALSALKDDTSHTESARDVYEPVQIIETKKSSQSGSTRAGNSNIDISQYGKGNMFASDLEKGEKTGYITESQAIKRVIARHRMTNIGDSEKVFDIRSVRSVLNSEEQNRSHSLNKNSFKGLENKPSVQFLQDFKTIGSEDMTLAFSEMDADQVFEKRNNDIKRQKKIDLKLTRDDVITGIKCDIEAEVLKKREDAVDIDIIYDDKSKTNDSFVLEAENKEIWPTVGKGQCNKEVVFIQPRGDNRCRSKSDVSVDIVEGQGQNIIKACPVYIKVGCTRETQESVSVGADQNLIQDESAYLKVIDQDKTTDSVSVNETDGYQNIMEDGSSFPVSGVNSPAKNGDAILKVSDEGYSSRKELNDIHVMSTSASSEVSSEKANKEVLGEQENTFITGKYLLKQVDIQTAELDCNKIETNTGFISSPLRIDIEQSCDELNRISPRYSDSVSESVNFLSPIFTNCWHDAPDSCSKFKVDNLQYHPIALPMGYYSDEDDDYDTLESGDNFVSVTEKMMIKANKSPHEKTTTFCQWVLYPLDEIKKPYRWQHLKSTEILKGKFVDENPFCVTQTDAELSKNRLNEKPNSLNKQEDLGAINLERMSVPGAVSCKDTGTSSNKQTIKQLNDTSASSIKETCKLLTVTSSSSYKDERNSLFDISTSTSSKTSKSMVDKSTSSPKVTSEPVNETSASSPRETSNPLNNTNTSNYSETSKSLIDANVSSYNETSKPSNDAAPSSKETIQQLNDTNSLSYNETSKPLNDANVSSYNETSKPLNDTNSSSYNETSKPLNDANSSSCNETSKPLNDANVSSYNETSKPLNDANVSSYNETSKPLNDTNSSNYSETSKPLNDENVSSYNETNKPLNDGNVSSYNETSKPLNDVNVSSYNETSKPLNNTSTSNYNETSKPLNDGSASSSKETSKPLNDGSASSYNETSKPLNDTNSSSYNETSKPLSDAAPSSKETIQQLNDTNSSSYNETSKPLNDTNSSIYNETSKPLNDGSASSSKGSSKPANVNSSKEISKSVIATSNLRCVKETNVSVINPSISGSPERNQSENICVSTDKEISEYMNCTSGTSPRTSSNSVITNTLFQLEVNKCINDTSAINEAAVMSSYTDSKNERLLDDTISVSREKPLMAVNVLQPVVSIGRPSDENRNFNLESIQGFIEMESPDNSLSNCSNVLAESEKISSSSLQCPDVTEDLSDNVAEVSSRYHKLSENPHSDEDGMLHLTESKTRKNTVSKNKADILSKEAQEYLGCTIDEKIMQMRPKKLPKYLYGDEISPRKKLLISYRGKDLSEKKVVKKGEKVSKEKNDLSMMIGVEQKQEVDSGSITENSPNNRINCNVSAKRKQNGKETKIDSVKCYEDTNFSIPSNQKIAKLESEMVRNRKDKKMSKAKRRPTKEKHKEYEADKGINETQMLIGDKFDQTKAAPKSGGRKRKNSKQCALVPEGTSENEGCLKSSECVFICSKNSIKTGDELSKLDVGEQENKENLCLVPSDDTSLMVSNPAKRKRGRNPKNKVGTIGESIKSDNSVLSIGEEQLGTASKITPAPQFEDTASKITPAPQFEGTASKITPAPQFEEKLALDLLGLQKPNQEINEKQMVETSLKLEDYQPGSKTHSLKVSDNVNIKSMRSCRVVLKRTRLSPRKYKEALKTKSKSKSTEKKNSGGKIICTKVKSKPGVTRIKSSFRKALYAKTKFAAKKLDFYEEDTVENVELTDCKRDDSLKKRNVTRSSALISKVGNTQFRIVTDRIEQKQIKENRHLTCNYCRQLLPKRDLLCHTKTSHPWRCAKCSQEFASKEERIFHFKEYHYGDEEHNCMICKMKFRHMTQMERHRKSIIHTKLAKLQADFISLIRVCLNNYSLNVPRIESGTENPTPSGTFSTSVLPLADHEMPLLEREGSQTFTSESFGSQDLLNKSSSNNQLCISGNSLSTHENGPSVNNITAVPNDKHSPLYFMWPLKRKLTGGKEVIVKHFFHHEPGMVELIRDLEFRLGAGYNPKLQNIVKEFIPSTSYDSIETIIDQISIFGNMTAGTPKPYLQSNMPIENPLSLDQFSGPEPRTSTEFPVNDSVTYYRCSDNTDNFSPLTPDQGTITIQPFNKVNPTGFGQNEQQQMPFNNVQSLDHFNMFSNASNENQQMVTEPFCTNELVGQVQPSITLDCGGQQSGPAYSDQQTATAHSDQQYEGQQHGGNSNSCDIDSGLNSLPFSTINRTDLDLQQGGFSGGIVPIDQSDTMLKNLTDCQVTNVSDQPAHCLDKMSQNSDNDPLSCSSGWFMKAMQDVQDDKFCLDLPLFNSNLLEAAEDHSKNLDLVDDACSVSIVPENPIVADITNDEFNLNFRQDGNKNDLFESYPDANSINECQQTDTERRNLDAETIQGEYNQISQDIENDVLTSSMYSDV